MQAPIFFKEISSQKELMDCYKLQQSIFRLNDRDSISPAYLSLLSRSNPRVGIIIGAYLKDNKNHILIGFVIAVFCKEKDAVYVPAIGVSENFQRHGAGMGLFSALKDIVLQWGIKKVKLLFDPFDTKLAMFYFEKLRVKGVSYLIEPYVLENEKIFKDKLLIEWEMFKSITNEGEHFYNKDVDLNNTNVLKNVETHNSKSDSCILIEIPDLKRGKDYRIEVVGQLELLQKRFDKYINQLKYHVVEYVYEANNTSGNYYLLRKN